MKKLFAMAVAMVMAFGAMAQRAESATAEVGTIKAPAFTITIEKDDSFVQEAMNQRLKEAGLKTKKTEGYVAVIDQLFAEISTSPINLYTKVERESRHSSKVTVCVIPTDLTGDRESLQANTRTFTESFAKYVARYEAKGNMEKEQDNLKKAQKQQSKAVSALEKIDNGIAKNKEKIADLKKDIEKYNLKIKECQEEIKKLEGDNAKNQEKRTEAQKGLDDANSNVKSVEGEVERYRSLSE